MDLKQIEYFLKVAELRSFSRAAEHLSIAQSALSRQVRLLELDLRQHLLYRNGRGVEPTEAGQRFMEHARAIGHTVERARQDMQSLQHTPSGKITIGLPPRVALAITPSLVQEFRATLPAGRISVAEGLSAQTREWLIQGRVDLALLYDPPPSPLLSYETLYREALVLVGAQGRVRDLPASIDAAELAHYPLILPSLPNAIRALAERVGTQSHIKLNVVAEVDAVHTIVELAARGSAYTILPISAITGHGNARQFMTARIEEDGAVLRNQLVLALPRSRPVTRLGQATAELLRSIDFASMFGGVEAVDQQS